MSILKTERPGFEARDHRLQRRQGAEKRNRTPNRIQRKGLFLSQGLSLGTKTLQLRLLLGTSPHSPARASLCSSREGGAEGT